MKQIDILLVEDSYYSADLNVRQLRKAGYIVHNRVVASRRAMEDALLDKQWDIILSDNSMPGFDALQAVEVRNRLAGLVPFVIVSEDIDEKDVEKAMKNGCCAYLAKENLSMLGPLVDKILAAENK